MAKDFRRILCLHTLDESYDINKNLDSIFGLLVKLGYKFVPLSSINKFEKNDKVLSVTFDDGYKDNLYNGYDLFDKYNIKPTVFIVTSQINNKFDHLKQKELNMYGLSMLSYDDLNEWIDKGYEVGFHTHNHLNMYESALEDIISDFETGVRVYNSIVSNGYRSFAYPYGYLPNKKIRAEVSKVLSKYEFKECYTTEWNSISGHKQTIPRVVIGDNDSTFKAVLKAIGLLDWVYNARYKGVMNEL